MKHNDAELTERQVQFGLIVPYIIAIVGVVVFTVPAVMHNVGHYNRCTESTMATVVSYTEDWYWDNSGSVAEEKVRYLAVIRYTVGGQEYVVQARTGSRSPREVPGSSVKVLYNPEDPREFCFIEDAGPLAVYAVLGIAGMVIVAGVSVWSIFRVMKVLPTLPKDGYM